MQIVINKSGRKVNLGKRETDLLNNAKALLAELANSAGGDIGTEADHAAEGITNTLLAIQSQGLEQVA